MENENVQEIKKGRGRPRVYDSAIKGPELSKLISQKFYKEHKGEKKICPMCNKSVSIFNYSHHIKGNKHQKEIEIKKLKLELESYKNPKLVEEI
jgi:hypothetical protein